MITSEHTHVFPRLLDLAYPSIERTLASISGILTGGGIPNIEVIQNEVNNILTGSILTERNLSYWRWLASEQGSTFEEVTAEFHSHIPLRRQGRPEELAALVTFLCSDQAGRITGQSIPVDGGISRHL